LKEMKNAGQDIPLSKRADLSYSKVKRILYETSGLVLSASRFEMKRNEITDILKDNIDGEEPEGEVIQRLIYSLANHETFFFRHQEQFDILRAHLLPELFKNVAEGQELNIWCAGCSYGQEAYSIAMLICEECQAAHSHIDLSKIRVFGTDISRQITEFAKEGIYSEKELRRMLPEFAKDLILKYFPRQDAHLVATKQIKALTQFSTVNLLLKEDYLDVGPFDIIFCRNVIMYFHRSLQLQVIEKIAAQIKLGGYLVLGPSERVGLEVGLEVGVEPIFYDNCVLYKKVREV